VKINHQSGLDEGMGCWLLELSMGDLAVSDGLVEGDMDNLTGITCGWTYVA